MYEKNLDHTHYFSTLLKKLGYKEGESVHLINAPDWFEVNLHKQHIIKNLHITSNTELVNTDWVHLFVTKRSELEEFKADLTGQIINKAIWVSWPKKSSKVKSDITEQILRDVLLPLGEWVDIKVIAVDEIWSGLKFSRRIK